MNEFELKHIHGEIAKPLVRQSVVRQQPCPCSHFEALFSVEPNLRTPICANTLHLSPALASELQLWVI